MEKKTCISKESLKEVLQDLSPSAIRSESFEVLVDAFIESLDNVIKFTDDFLEYNHIDLINKEILESLDESKKEKYKLLKKELIHTYLAELNDTVSKANVNSKLIKRLKEFYTELGVESPEIDLHKKIEQVITQSFINAHKDYRNSKGRFTNFLYIFDVLNKANIQNTGEIFIELVEGNGEEKEPFVYNIESSMFPETFDNIIKPLCHPVGFGVKYYKLLKLVLEDYFNVKFEFELTDIRVDCVRDDGSTVSTDLTKVYEILDYEEIELPNQETKVFQANVIDRRNNQERFLYKDTNSRFYVFNKKEYEIDTLKIDNTFGEIAKISETEFRFRPFIEFQRDLIRVTYTIKNDALHTNYTSILVVPELDPIIGSRYKKDFIFTKKELIAGTQGEIRGKTEIEYGEECSLNYVITRKEIPTLYDENSFKSKQYIFDYWARYTEFNTYNWQELLTDAKILQNDRTNTFLYNQFPLVDDGDGIGFTGIIGQKTRFRTDHIRTFLDPQETIHPLEFYNYNVPKWRSIGDYHFYTQVKNNRDFELETEEYTIGVDDFIIESLSDEQFQELLTTGYVDGRPYRGKALFVDYFLEVSYNNNARPLAENPELDSPAWESTDFSFKSTLEDSLDNFSDEASFSTESTFIEEVEISEDTAFSLETSLTAEQYNVKRLYEYKRVEDFKIRDFTEKELLSFYKGMLDLDEVDFIGYYDKSTRITGISDYTNFCKRDDDLSIMLY